MSLPASAVGSEDGSARVWDLRSRQCLRTINSPNKAPVSTALLISWPGYLAGQHAGQSGGRTGPKRQQPLAPLAKYAGRWGCHAVACGFTSKRQPFVPACLSDLACTDAWELRPYLPNPLPSSLLVQPA